MGSSFSNAGAALPPSFVEAFNAVLGARAALPFAEFMALALYHPELGYYRRARRRVGRSADTDFYTATDSGALFGELVAAACVRLLGAREPADHTFVEIGAEPRGGILEGVAHPFGASRTIRVGEALQLSGKCVVFSNELFDAQPIRRFVRGRDGWRELGVRLDAGGALEEVVLPEVVDEAWLPADAPEGYHYDAPRAAVDLASRIAAQAWTGLFLAFDYGYSADILAKEMPQGTVRAYHRHRQHNALLARPGEQDLTGHVCWDWLGGSLSAHGFAIPRVESQEAFFMTHAGERIAAVLRAEAAGFSRRKMSLMQLLHPGNLGQKFQTLHAVRG